MSNKILAGPWCEIAEVLTRNMSETTAYTARLLVTALSAIPEAFTPEKRAAAGKAARRLLEFAWRKAPRDPWLIEMCIELVCRTYESDSAASGAILRKALEPAQVASFGFQELPRLTSELKRLIAHDPVFVADSCIAVFSNPETSTEQTDMGQSRILSLSSNRRQDYGMAQHHVVEFYPEFLKQAPTEAARALIGILEAYVPRAHPQGFSDAREDRAVIGARSAQLLPDGSSIWDDRVYREIHDELKILDLFQTGMDALAATAAGQQTADCILSMMVNRNRLAIGWRRLFRLGAKFPGTLGRALIDYASNKAFLLCADTQAPGAALIGATFASLPVETRSSIETSIMALPDAFPEDRRVRGERLRDELLLKLPTAQLTTDAARTRVAGLTAPEAGSGRESILDEKEDLIESGWTSRSVSDEEDLIDRGVPIDAEPNKKLRALSEPVKAIANAPQSDSVSLTGVGSIRTLMEALKTADRDGVHPQQRDHACGRLAEACANISQHDTATGELLAVVREALLFSSESPDPKADEPGDHHFDEHPSWGAPCARIEAAEGLMWLARKPENCTPAVFAAIERLATTDQTRAVRFQVARSLNALYYSAPDLMWRLAAHFSRHEQSCGVLRGFLTQPISILARADENRAATMAIEISSRIEDGPGAEGTRANCFRLLAQLFIWRDNNAARDAVFSSADHPIEDSQSAHHVLLETRDRMTHGPVSPPDPAADAIRSRALTLFERIMKGAFAAMQEIERQHAGVAFDKWSETDRGLCKNIARLIDSCGDEIYFGSGAYGHSRHAGTANQKDKVSTAAMQRFYGEGGHLIDQLAESGFASVAHHLLETLQEFIPFDPRGVFLRIGKVVTAGARGNYQFESLGASLLVAIVERYLAEYAALLRDDADCRKALMDSLDLFVRAGWPAARSLTYRLEEIYR